MRRIECSEAAESGSCRSPGLPSSSCLIVSFIVGRQPKDADAPARSEIAKWYIDNKDAAEDRRLHRHRGRGLPDLLRGLPAQGAGGGRGCQGRCCRSCRLDRALDRRGRRLRSTTCSCSQPPRRPTTSRRPRSRRSRRSGTTISCRSSSACSCSTVVRRDLRAAERGPAEVARLGRDRVRGHFAGRADRVLRGARRRALDPGRQHHAVAAGALRARGAAAPAAPAAPAA